MKQYWKNETYLAGNIILQPCFDHMRKSGKGYRVIGSLENTNRVMKDSFWVGVYPGLTDANIDYMLEAIHQALQE